MKTSQIAINESHQHLVNLANKMSETQQVLQTVWQSYDQRFSNVDENLAKALEGIVQNIGANLLSMKSFVTEVDAKLGESISGFGQNISALNETAENFEDAASKLLMATDNISNGKVLSQVGNR